MTGGEDPANFAGGAKFGVAAGGQQLTFDEARHGRRTSRGGNGAAIEIGRGGSF